jgi:hypothetical protein
MLPVVTPDVRPHPSPGPTTGDVLDATNNLRKALDPGR